MTEMMCEAVVSGYCARRSPSPHHVLTCHLSTLTLSQEQQQHQQHQQEACTRGKKIGVLQRGIYHKKTYNSGDSLVVTHLTTSPPVHCLSKAERTGSPVLSVLWSYVEDFFTKSILISKHGHHSGCLRFTFVLAGVYLHHMQLFAKSVTFSNTLVTGNILRHSC